MYYAARKQHIEWLEERLAEEEAKLREAEARVIELQGSVAYYKQAIEQLSPPPSATSSSANNSGKDNPVTQEESSFSPVRQTLLLESIEEVLEEKGIEYYEDAAKWDRENKRNPKEMLRLEYKDFTLMEAATFFLEDAKGRALRIEDIAEKLFETYSQEEFQRAKNSLAAELRRGAREGRWQKNGRGMFFIDPCLSQPQEMPLNKYNGLSQTPL